MNNKKTIAWFLAALMALLPLAAPAEDVLLDDAALAPGLAQPEIRRIDSAEFGPFVVGVAGKLTGDFFTNLWGNSTYDMDLRSMLHGYETVVFGEQYDFIANPVTVAALDQQAHKDGGKTYTLTIQDGLRYSDGSPITAADYVFSLLFQASPQARELGGATDCVSHIQGYDAFNAGEASTLTGLRLLDKRRFSITVKPECLPFFYELSMVQANPYPIAVIAPGCQVADDGQGAYIRNLDASNPQPVFTAELLRLTVLDSTYGYAAHPSVVSGPYMLRAFDAETGEAQLAINPNFLGDWRGQQPTIDNVVVRRLPPAEMIGALERGEVHLANKVVTGDDITAGLNSEVELKRSLYPRLGFGFIAFACEVGPTRFEAVRQAIGAAVDVPAFVAEYNQSYGLQVGGYYGLGQWMVQLIMTGGPAALDDPASTVNLGTPEEWAALSLDQVPLFQPDLEKAKALLVGDGWTLNAQGQAFQEGVDTLRYKQVDGELMPLTLRFAKQKESAAAELLVLKLMEPMAALGMQLEVIELSFPDLLRSYYRKGERLFNMAFLATNFSSVFDPYFVFSTGESLQGTLNTSGLQDQELEQSALALRQVPPGDLLTYCQKWLSFQQVFQQKLPMLPLYSNVYGDFSVPLLQDYNPSQGLNWPNALLYAYLGEEPAVAPGTEALDGTLETSGEGGPGGEEELEFLE